MWFLLGSTCWCDTKLLSLCIDFQGIFKASWWWKDHSSRILPVFEIRIARSQWRCIRAGSAFRVCGLSCSLLFVPSLSWWAFCIEDLSFGIVNKLIITLFWDYSSLVPWDCSQSRSRGQKGEGMKQRSTNFHFLIWEYYTKAGKKNRGKYFMLLPFIFIPPLSKLSSSLL